MSNIYGYVRVSTIAQATDGESLDTQSRQISNYVMSKGWEISSDNIFVESGVSGGSEFQQRPKGSALLDVLSRGDVLVIAKLDRAFRNVQNAFATLQNLKTLGVQVHFIDLGGECTGNGIGSVVFGVMAVFAAFERDRISSRIREVKQNQKSQGKFVGGRTAFGYTTRDGIKVPRDDEQKIIVKMQEQRNLGKSFRAIESWLKQTHSVTLSYMGVRQVLGRAVVLT